ncbi:hypothetical protein O181_104981 [Austropuccinia psidii MF-1]|uniref:Uncharacterized protein n=1 Tax=Austropuccinia psidii MF-1 TaxID=1389203 RepID=A0A9Q3PLW0_9BASI|nr:hypothetical protein [Austropuccinia psidii MF-1]
MPAFPFSVAAFAATELQLCPPALKLRLLRVLQLLRSSQLHHGIKDHLHTTSSSLSFSPAPLCSSSPTVVLLVRIPLGLPAFPLFSFALHLTHSPSYCLIVFPADPFRPPLLSTLLFTLYTKREQNPPNPPKQDSPIPSLPRKQTPRQATPGPSCTRWSEELFLEPSQIKEPPIPGLSPSSQPPEDDMTSFPHPSFDHLQLVRPLPAP